MSTKRRKISVAVGAVAAVGVAGFLILTSPWTWSLTHSIPATASVDGPIDIENGRRIFVASDCATCHATTGQDNDELLGGGMVLDTDFGRFHMPNISPDPKYGIGTWTLEQFDRAIRQGVGPSKILPDGQNLYPAFPYTSYVRLTPEDVRDMYGYMKGLPATDKLVPDHELKFPYNIRRGIGVWRLAFLDSKSVEEVGVSSANLPDEVDPDVFALGRYLVESAGHCVECHSPRTFMGNIPTDQRYAGGPNPEGTGYFPNITPAETGLSYWSAAAMTNYLHTGVSPIGRTAGGDMAEVIENTSLLDWSDLKAMATYVRHLPPIEKPAPGMPEPNWTDKVVTLDTAFDSRPMLPTTRHQEINAGVDVYVAGTKSLYLNGAMGDEGIEDGKLLSGAAAKVLERDGNNLKLEIKGWQPEDAPAVIYQEKGQRVIMAALSDDGAAALQRGEGSVDPNTDQVWLPVTLTAWSDAMALNLDLETLWNYSRDAYVQSCSSCHTMPKEEDYSSNQWVGTMKSMERFTTFSDDEYRLILAYLQNHSADLGPKAGSQHSRSGGAQ